MAHPAHIHQFPGLGFHSLGRIYDDNDTIGRGKGPEGILRKILVPGCVQDVDLFSPYSNPMTEVATEIPRCFSISIKSEVAVFLILLDFTAPATLMAPPNNRNFRSVWFFLHRDGLQWQRFCASLSLL
jgi:hypothetical protein